MPAECFLETEKDALCFPPSSSYVPLCVQSDYQKTVFHLFMNAACMCSGSGPSDAGALQPNRPDIPWSPPPAVNSVRDTTQRGKEKWKNLNL